MREKLWKKIERVIADDKEYSLRQANTHVFDDDEVGFAIYLRRTGVDVDEYEKKPKREPFRCRIGFHKWDEWSEVEFVIGNYHGPHQMRNCTKCNKRDRINV